MAMENPTLTDAQLAQIRIVFHQARVPEGETIQTEFVGGPFDGLKKRCTPEMMTWCLSASAVLGEPWLACYEAEAEGVYRFRGWERQGTRESGG